MSEDTLAPDLSSLAAIARDGNLDMRPVLLRVRTDLFLAAPSRSPELIDSFTALACGLIPIVAPGTVALVAKKLAAYPDTPLEVIECLLGRGGEIAEIVLSASPHLPRRSLEEVVSRGTTPMVLAVARRQLLDERIFERIVGRSEPVLDEELARNVEASIPTFCLETLLERARSEPVLAALLALRPDISGARKASLYGHADRDVRDGIIADVTRLVALDGRGRPHRQLAAEDADLLVMAAADADKPTFVTALASLLNTSAAHAAQLVNEPSGELLTLSLAAIEMPREAAHRIFLTLDPAIARSVQRVFGFSDLMRRVKQRVASRIIDGVLGRPGRRLRETTGTQKTGAYVPVSSGTSARPFRLSGRHVGRGAKDRGAAVIQVDAGIPALREAQRGRSLVFARAKPPASNTKGRHLSGSPRESDVPLGLRLR